MESLLKPTVYLNGKAKWINPSGQVRVVDLTFSWFQFEPAVMYLEINFPVEISKDGPTIVQQVRPIGRELFEQAVKEPKGQAGLKDVIVYPGPAIPNPNRYTTPAELLLTTTVQLVDDDTGLLHYLELSTKALRHLLLRTYKFVAPEQEEAIYFDQLDEEWEEFNSEE